MFRCEPDLKVMITSIEPRKWVTPAIELGKLQLVNYRKVLVIIVFTGSTVMTTTDTHARSPIPDRGFDVGESDIEGRLLLLIGHRGLQSVDLIGQELERADDVLDGGEARDDISECHVLVSSRAGGGLAHGGSRTCVN